jgi:putative FmdB family regulatory protein
MKRNSWALRSQLPFFTGRKQQSSARMALEFLYTNPTEEFSMPQYDYVCNDCHKTFEQALTLDEHDHQLVKCPKCGSKNVEQEAAAFFAVTSKKS